MCLSAIRLSTVAALAAVALSSDPSGALFRQSAEAEARMQAGLEEALRAIEDAPRFKRFSAQRKQDLVEFVVGNTLFVMAHEMGHVAISELGLPVLGREEDAADSFAIVAAIQLGTDYSRHILMQAVKGWLYSSRRDRKEKIALAFHDGHGLDLQRAYNVVCMLVGSDRERFKSLAQEAMMPEDRQASCVQDYKNALWSWEQLLKPRERKPDQPKAAIPVEYKDNDEDYSVYATVLRHMGVLEAFAGYAQERYTWPRPFRIEAQACGEANAHWNVVTQTLRFCYELAEEFLNLYVDHAGNLSVWRAAPE
jgi:hypothetical protein